MKAAKLNEAGVSSSYGRTDGQRRARSCVAWADGSAAEWASAMTFFHEVADRFGEQRRFVRQDRAVVVFRCVVQRRIGEQEVGDHRQAPARYLHLRRVPVERCGGPGMHHTSADQAAGDLEDDGGDIDAGEEALAILERLRRGAVFQSHRAFLKAPKPTPLVAKRSGARPAYARQP